VNLTPVVGEVTDSFFKLRGRGNSLKKEGMKIGFLEKRNLG